MTVVGESHYQDALQTLYRKNGGSDDDNVKVVAALVPEDDNAFDANAVRINRIRSVGYLIGRWLYSIERR